MSRKTTHTENLASLTLPHSERRKAQERYKKAVAAREDPPPWKIRMDMSTFEKLLESDKVRIIEQSDGEMIIEIEDDGQGEI